MIKEKQLSMEKRLYENQIMRKALLKEMDIIFKNIEYAQAVAESMHQGASWLTKLQSKYRIIGDKLAESKFYFLSSTFLVVKDIDELSKTTLKQHFEANRPIDNRNSIAVSPMLFAATLKNIKEASISKVSGYKKYKNKKFDEYFGYFIEKINEAVNELEENVIPHYR